MDIQDLDRAAIEAALASPQRAITGDADLSNLAAIQTLCGRAERVFRIVPPGLEGFWCLGGQVRNGDGAPLSVTGTGLSMQEALIRLGGEVAEALAISGLEAFGTIKGQDLATGNAVEMLWGDLFQANEDFSRSGCAAGPGPQAATLSALMEVIERDAAMLWWDAGRPATRIAPPTEFQIYRDQVGELPEGRTSHALLLDDSFGAASVAVVSFDATGHGMCCGTAARPSLTLALKAAYREMCQMIVGLSVARLKRDGLGVAALSPGDKRQLERADVVEASMVLQGDEEILAHPGTEVSFHDIVQNLTDAGHAPVAIPLPLGVDHCAVTKVVAPDLQPSMPHIETIRILQFKTKFGGGAGPRTGCPLY